MGCFQERPLYQEHLSINGIFILNREPTQGKHSQSVEIKVVQDDGLWDTIDDAPVRVVEEDYKLTLTLPTESPEIQSNSLKPIFLSILMRSNKANKTTLLIQQPSFTTDDPLLTKSITTAVFKQLAIALADFASQVYLRSLKWVYFQWQQEEVSQLYGKVQEDIRSMRVLLV